MIKKILSLVDQKLLRFIIVGCINTVVGTAIMFGIIWHPAVTGCHLQPIIF